MPRGGKQTTGRFDTREELVEAVWFWWRFQGTTQAQIARICQVSEATVANILNKGEQHACDRTESE